MSTPEDEPVSGSSAQMAPVAEARRWAGRNLPPFDSRHSGTDAEVAAELLALLNFRDMSYEDAMRVTTAFIGNVRAAARAT